MATAHQSPADSLPPLSQKQVNTTTWGATPNTLTIADVTIHANSIIHAYVTGTVPAAGRWSYTITNGQVVITSTDAESSTLPVSYVVL